MLFLYYEVNLNMFDFDFNEIENRCFVSFNNANFILNFEFDSSLIHFRHKANLALQIFVVK